MTVTPDAVLMVHAPGRRKATVPKRDLFTGLRTDRS